MSPTYHLVPTTYLVAPILLVATLAAAPWAFGAVQTWAWASLALLALLLLLLWGTGNVQEGVLRIAWSPLYLPAALFLILVMIQFSGRLTLDPIATRESLLKLITNLIFFFLAGQLWASGREKSWRGLGLTVTVLAFALALFAILQFFSSQGLIYWVVKPRWGGWVFGPYVNHNHYAGLMEMLIPVATGYALSRPKKQPVRALLGFAVLVPTASVLLSGSRGGFIALLAESLILAAVVLGPAPAHNRRIQVTAWALGITAATFLFFWIDPNETSKHLTTVAKLASSPEVTLGERRWVARDALRIFRDHPWLGTGLGSFETAYPRYQSFPSDLEWDHVHNDYAEALAENGLVGGSLIAAALVMFFRLAFRSLGERLQHESGWIQMGAAVGCCGLLVHSLVDFNLHIPANAAWLAVCAAWATSGFAVSRLKESAGRPYNPATSGCVP